MFALNTKDMNTLNIEEEKVQNTYQKASDEQKKVLEQLFGVDTFKLKYVTDRIKTFADALKELGPNHPLVKEYKYLCYIKVPERILNYSKLCVITAALNEGWKPRYIKGERRYYPYFIFCTNKDIEETPKETSCIMHFSKDNANEFNGIYFHSGDSEGISAVFNPSLVFKTRELAIYAGKQFIELYADYYLKYL